jgi:toxin ParE1/3/4
LEKVRLVKLSFSAEARDNIETIYDYIKERNPIAASNVAARIYRSAEGLRQFPHMGRIGLAAGTREWVVPGLPYILVYEVRDGGKEILVLTVFHGARDRGDNPPEQD